MVSPRILLTMFPKNVDYLCEIVTVIYQRLGHFQYCILADSVAKLRYLFVCVYNRHILYLLINNELINFKNLFPCFYFENCTSSTNI